MFDTSNITKDVNKIRYKIKQAFEFYRKFIFNEDHQAVIVARGFHVAGSVAPVDWEVFGSILIDDLGKQGYGSDLTHHEVKSSVAGNSFEYQYHLNGGKQKLLEDMVINHIFISYSPDYKDIEVRLVEGRQLKEKFEKWMPALIKNYEGPKDKRKQRFRRSVANGFVKRNGILILKTQDGSLVETV